MSKSTGSTEASARDPGSSKFSDGPPIVFISASRDLTAEVEALFKLLAVLGRRAVPRFEPCYWKFSDVDYHPGRTFQAQLPDILDPRVKGLICLFGERVGVKLPADFPAPPDFTVPEGFADPWQPVRHNNSNLPLTGTLFEYFRGRQRVRLEGLGASAGFFMLTLFKGNPDYLKDSSREPIARQWGNLSHFTNTVDPKKPGYAAAHAEYLQQISALARFCDQHHFSSFPVQCFANTDDLKNRVSVAIRPHFDILPVAITNPFKGLQPYQISDGRFYFGRATEVDRIVSMLRQCEPPLPRFLVLTGSSGSGKSSLLHAGILHRLSRRNADGRFVAVPTRPTDVLQASGSPLSALLAQVIERCRKVEGDPVPGEVLDALGDLANDTSSDISPVAFAKICHRICLNGLRLCIGVDQVEELMVPEPGESAQARVAFLRTLLLLSQEPDIWVIVALNSAWLLKWERWLSDTMSIDQLSSDRHPMTFTIGDPGRSDLWTIVESSFDQISLGLDRNLIEAIVDSAVSISKPTLQLASEGRDAESRPSILPLVSLTLSRIYERWLVDNKEALRLAGARLSPAAQEPALKSKLIMTEQFWRELIGVQPPRVENTLLLAKYAALANIESAVAAVGEKAWSAYLARVEVHDVQDKAVVFARLFRRLVHVSRGVPLSLGRCSQREAASIGAEVLLETLVEHRLCGMIGMSGGGELVEDSLFELFHERIIQAWPRARDWYQSDKADKELLETIRDQARYYFDAPEDRDRANYVASSRQQLREAILLLPRWGEDAATPGVDLVKYVLEALRIIDLPRFDAATDAQVGGGNPLAFAAGHGRTDILAEYIARGCPADFIRAGGDPPLTHAVANGKIDAADLLRKAGAEIDKPGLSTRQAAPLHYAVQYGQQDAVEWLLKHGADPRHKDALSFTPIQYAAAYGKDEIALACLETLLRRGELPAADTRDAMFAAVDAGHVNVVEALIAHRQQLCGTGLLDPEILFRAIASSNYRLRIVELLLDVVGTDECPKRPDGDTPLTLALSQQRTSCAELLIGKRLFLAEAGLDGLTPLHIAISKRDEAITRALLRAGAPVDGRDAIGTLPVHRALRDGWDVLLPDLVCPGLDLNRPSKLGELPLVLASASGASAVPSIKLLVRCGASLENEDGAGMTPLIMAAYRGNDEAVTLLLDLRARLDAPNATGETILHVVAASKHEKRAAMARRLFDCGASVDRVSGKGETVLHKACANWDEDLVTWLLERGLKFDTPNHRGVTPWHHMLKNAPHAFVAAHFDDVEHPLREPGVEKKDGATGPGAMEGTEEGMLDWFLGRQEREPQLLGRLVAAGYKVPRQQVTRPDFLVRALVGPGANDELVPQVIDIMERLEQGEMLPPLSLQWHLNGPTPSRRFIARALRKVDLASNQAPLFALLSAMLNDDGSALAMAIARSGPDVCYDARSGFRPYHLAVTTHSRAGLDELYRLQADINARDNDGWTPLLLAVQSGDIDAVKTLLDRNARPDVRLPDGRGPLELARDASDAAMFKYLKLRLDSVDA